jgi:hypothetical protein
MNIAPLPDNPNRAGTKAMEIAIGSYSTGDVSRILRGVRVECQIRTGNEKAECARLFSEIERRAFAEMEMRRNQRPTI